MVRRSLGVALWFVVGLLACFLGALASLVGTGAGRELLGRSAEVALARVVAGRIEVGDVSGSLLTGVTLTDVRLFDAETSLVAVLPRADVSYNPFDFAAGRAVLLELHLYRPLINLVEHANGRLNLEELLRLGRKDRGGVRRPAPLILFRHVRIDDGSLVLRLQDRPSPDDSLHEIDPLGTDGRRRVRRFDHLNADLLALRLSSPRERGILIDINSLAVASNDPRLQITDARGRVVVAGDSLEARLERLSFPGSQLAARGRVRWPRDTLLYDLDLRVDSATLTDFRFIDPRFPAGGVLRGGLTLRSRGSRVLEVQLDPLDLVYHGGTLAGRVTAISSAGRGLVALRQGDLTASEFDLEFTRAFLDTLPFAGRLSGHTSADGRLAALSLEVDWVFRDSLVEGWPVTPLKGRGEVDVASPEGIRFQPFAIEAAELDLGTVRRLVPGFRLQGTLDAAGTLSGPYRNAEFSGSLRHRDGLRPPSQVRGLLRLDSRSDTLGVFADVYADSLAFEGLRGSFPSLLLSGTAGGNIRLDGTLAALETHVDLTAAGNGGRVRGDGVLVLLPSRTGARDYTLRAYDLDLRRWVSDAPSSRLGFAVVGTAVVDSGAAPIGALTARVEPSIFAGTVLDSGIAVVRLANARLNVDSLRLAQAGMITTGRGSIAWRSAREPHVDDNGNGGGDGGATAADELTLELDAGNLGALDSLARWLTGGGAREGARTAEALRGSARVTLGLRGALDSLTLAAQGTTVGLRWRGWSVSSGRGRLVYDLGPNRVFAVDVALDSLSRTARRVEGGEGGRGEGAAAADIGEEMGFGAVSAAARGRPDSLTWFARSRVGDLGAFLAGGRLERRHGADSGTTVAVNVDSLALLLPGGVWLLEAPASVLVGDSIVRIGSLAVANTGGPGRLTLEGDLPTRGRANANLHLEGFPLAGVYALLQRDTLGVGGALTATFGLIGTRADPEYRGSFALSDGSFGQFRAPFVDGTVQYADQRLDAGLNLWRSGQQILSLTAHLPLDLSLQTVAERQLPDTLSVEARADSVDLSVLEAVTPLLRQVRGDFSADLGIRGTWASPQLRGSLEIGNAAAYIPALNVRWERVNGRLALSGDTIRVDSLTVASERGRAEVTGFVRLERLTRPVLNFAITADRFTALDLRGYLSVTASGRLTLTGPVIGATLAGRGTVTSGVLHFADMVNKRVVNLDEPWVATLIDTALAATIRRQRLGPEFESVFLDSLRIRGLELAMGNDAWLRSSEANIQLTGTVTVTKERNTYLLTGTLQAPRGTYRLVVGPVTREFVVTQGTVRYFGTPDLDAALNIEARHVVHPVPGPGVDQDITIIARIRGSLLVPQLTLEAEGQELSQSEIISYLLFGQPNIAGDQGALSNRGLLVQNALASIAAGELERSIVSDLGVPLDYFEIRPGDPTAGFSGTRVAAGWQIGRKTFLVLNAGFCGGEQSLNVGNTLGASLQYRMSPEWRTEASFAPVQACGAAVPGRNPLVETRQIGLDLFWERRY